MKNRFIGLAAVYMLIPAMLLAQPAGKKQLVGVWAVKVSPVGQSQSPLLSLAMFSGDGSFTTGVGYKTLPPIPVVQDVATELGPGYGRWAATGDREFRLTFYAVMRKASEFRRDHPEISSCNGSKLPQGRLLSCSPLGPGRRYGSLRNHLIRCSVPGRAHAPPWPV
jgi:hypothetical protein